MAKDPAFLFYTQDFLTGIMFMTNEQIGIYIKLLCAQHQHGGMIDKDGFNNAIGDHLIIKKKFIETDDGFYNERLMDEMVKRCKKSNNMSANAKKRWEKHNQKKSKSNAIASSLHMQTEDEDENEDESKNGIKKKDTKQTTKTYDFESVWIKHPNKLGKDEALGQFNTTVKTDQDFADINKAIDTFNKYHKINKTIKKYIQKGCNWFYDWKDWVDYVVDEPEQEPEEFKTHIVQQSIEKQLSGIATDNNIENCMKQLPKSAWHLVKAYLKRRYPDGGEKAYYKIEDKIMRDNHEK